MLKYDFKEASVEKKNEMLSEIISKYNVSNKNELIQALGHCQAVLDCTQEEFGSHPSISISTRQVRTHKKDYLDLYELALAKYQQSPDLKDIDGDLDEDALEAVYTNLLARLKSPKTSTKDLAIILEYFGIGKDQFKQFADFRNATMRGYLSDNLSQIVTDEGKALLIKSVIAESPFLYQGTERTAGNTLNAQAIDLDNPIVRLEAQTLGLLFMSLFNGQATDAFVNHAETLRLLKLASGAMTAKEMERSFREFDRIDGKVPPIKPVTPKMEKELIQCFGQEEGSEMYAMLVRLASKTAQKTAIKMPKYEDVKHDYEVHLKNYPELEEMSFKIMLAKLDARDEKLNKAKYKQYLEVNED